MERVRRKTLAALAGLALAAALPLGAVRAQDNEPPPADPGLGPIPRFTTLYLAERSLVTVSFNGDYGPVRVTGTLEQAPSEPLRLTDTTGRKREAAWNEVRAMTQVRTPAEGYPEGSFTVQLTSDPTSPGLTSDDSTYISPSVASTTTAQTVWRLLSVPEGQVTLKGDTFGSLTLPTARITGFGLEPVQGSVAQLPAGAIRMEILNGTAVGVPIPEIQSLRRDLKANTISVRLADGQLFTGKLLELPRVAIQFEGNRPAVPLERVAVMEVRLPTRSLLGETN